MATFGQGSAELIEVKTIEIGSTLTSAIVYTVPAGRYAEINKLRSGVSGTVFMRLNYGGGLVEDVNTGTSSQIIGDGYTLNEGDQIRLVNAANVYIFIKEFKKP